jgi:hypothetical protein
MARWPCTRTRLVTNRRDEHGLDSAHWKQVALPPRAAPTHHDPLSSPAADPGYACCAAKDEEGEVDEEDLTDEGGEGLCGAELEDVAAGEGDGAIAGVNGDDEEGGGEGDTEED